MGGQVEDDPSAAVRFRGDSDSRDFESRILLGPKESVFRDHSYKTSLLLVLDVVPDKLDVLIGEGADMWASAFRCRWRQLTKVVHQSDGTPVAKSCNVLNVGPGMIRRANSWGCINANGVNLLCACSVGGM